MAAIDQYMFSMPRDWMSIRTVLSDVGHSIGSQGFNVSKTLIILCGCVDWFQFSMFFNFSLMLDNGSFGIITCNMIHVRVNAFTRSLSSDSRFIQCI